MTTDIHLPKNNAFLRDQYAPAAICRAMIMNQRVFLRAKPEHISGDNLLRRYTPLFSPFVFSDTFDFSRTKPSQTGSDPVSLPRFVTCDGIVKEMIMFLAAYNLVRLVMLRSAMQQGVKPDRISFIDTLRWLCSEASFVLIPNLLINPDRPGRYQPRVNKRAKDKYPRMTRPRKQYHDKHLKNIGVMA